MATLISIFWALSALDPVAVLIAFFVGSFGGSFVGQIAYRNFRDGGGLTRRISPSSGAIATSDIIETCDDYRNRIPAHCANCEWDGYATSLDVPCPWCGEPDALYENEPERY